MANEGAGPMLSVEHALRTCRVIWAAMVIGIVTISGVVIALALQSNEATPSFGEWLMFAIACAFLLTWVPIGLFVRGQVFKRGWRADVVTPQAYFTGNIIAWACCEGVALLAAVTCYLDRRIWPNVIPLIAALVVLLLLWPNGRAMSPHVAEPINPYRDL